MKKIWLLCLCLASLGLAGCFHIPDEDWLPSKNKVNTWNTQNEEVENALNSFMDWINVVSTQRNGIKSEENEESEQIITEDSDENVIEIEDDSTADNESVDWGTWDIVGE